MKKLFKELNTQYRETFLNCPWDDKNFLASWSAQTYYFTKHITRIMALCSAQCKFEHEDAHKFFIEHLREEWGHHRIAEKDVEKLGFDLAHFPELPSTRLLYEPQYFKASYDPISFYGFGLMLEWLAVDVGVTIYQRIKKAGLESNFLKVHVKEDVEHSDHAEELINKFPGEQMERIKQNCHQTFVAYDLVLKEAADYARKNLSKKAA